MNLVALSVGILIAFFTIGLFGKLKIFNRHAAYAGYLASFPVYYWIFALASNSYNALFNEVLVGLIFFLLAGLSLTLPTANRHLILGFAYLLHAGYDMSHPVWFANPGTPLWWTEFCAVIDVILGIYILSILIGRQSRVSLKNCREVACD